MQLMQIDWKLGDSPISIRKGTKQVTAIKIVRETSFGQVAFLLGMVLLGVKFPGPSLAGSCAEKPILLAPI